MKASVTCLLLTFSCFSYANTSERNCQQIQSEMTRTTMYTIWDGTGELNSNIHDCVCPDIVNECRFEVRTEYSGRAADWVKPAIANRTLNNQMKSRLVDTWARQTHAGVARVTNTEKENCRNRGMVVINDPDRYNSFTCQADGYNGNSGMRLLPENMGNFNGVL